MWYMKAYVQWYLLTVKFIHLTHFGLGEKEGDEPVVLTDILGLEDALGTMDFKVAGNETGITTFQLDIKSEGLTLEILVDALKQV